MAPGAVYRPAMHVLHGVAGRKSRSACPAAHAVQPFSFLYAPDAHGLVGALVGDLLGASVGALQTRGGAGHWRQRENNSVQRSLT